MSGQITKKRSTNGVYEMLSKSFKHLNSRKAAAAAAAALSPLSTSTPGYPSAWGWYGIKNSRSIPRVLLWHQAESGTGVDTLPWLPLFCPSWGTTPNSIPRLVLPEGKLVPWNQADLASFCFPLWDFPHVLSSRSLSCPYLIHGDAKKNHLRGLREDLMR